MQTDLGKFHPKSTRNTFQGSYYTDVRVAAISGTSMLAWYRMAPNTKTVIAVSWRDVHPFHPQPMASLNMSNSALNGRLTKNKSRFYDSSSWHTGRFWTTFKTGQIWNGEGYLPTTTQKWQLSRRHISQLRHFQCLSCMVR